MTSLEVLRTLPKYPATSHLVDTRSKCEICQDCFALDEEICTLPCIHKLYFPFSLQLTQSHNLYFQMVRDSAVVSYLSARGWSRKDGGGDTAPGGAGITRGRGFESCLCDDVATI